MLMLKMLIMIIMITMIMKMMAITSRSDICRFHGCLNIRFTPLASNLDAPPMIPRLTMMILILKRRMAIFLSQYFFHTSHF